MNHEWNIQGDVVMTLTPTASLADLVAEDHREDGAATRRPQLPPEPREDSPEGLRAAFPPRRLLHGGLAAGRNVMFPAGRSSLYSQENPP